MDQQNYELDQTGAEETPKKKKGSTVKGIVIGVIGTLLISWTGINVACLATNSQILITNKESADDGEGAVLDADTVSKINELTAYTKLYYYDDIENEKLQDGLYTGLIDGLGDKYSVYYNAEDYQALQISTTGQYYGIGAGLSQDKDTMVVTVNKVYEGTPSESAGLLKDDVIVSVDGTEAVSMELSELVKLIRGEKGTTVHLEIYRPSTEENLSFDVERQDITLPSVSHKMFEDGIGYVHIDSFETETAAQFEEAVKDLENQGMKALIIDVRYNTGGMVALEPEMKQLSASELKDKTREFKERLDKGETLDDILPEGTVVYTEDKNGNRQDYTSSGDTYLDYPLAVLINGESASAAEILAGAVKDYQYGTLIGTTTFGKGIVQTIFPLENGDAVKLTTAKYFTPKGNYIHGVGIEPDIELEYEYLDKDATSYDEAYDNQIQKAIEVLKDKIQ